MLPETIFQMNYQDYAKLVENNLDFILNYERENNIKFDVVLSKLRNGVFAGSIISTNLHIPMGTVEVIQNKDLKIEHIYFPYNIQQKLNEKINILLVDSICNTGETLNKIKDFFTNNFSNIKLVTFCPLVSMNAQNKPDIVGISLNKYIQTPWERFSYTPQANLDKLENGVEKTQIIDSFYIGICSDFCNEEIAHLLPKKDEKRWYAIFHHEAESINTPSQISSQPVNQNIGIKEAKKIYKNYIKEKINFIQENGITHFIEDNLEQAILLSESCPTCHIVFYTDEEFYKIYAKNQNKKNLFVQT